MKFNNINYKKIGCVLATSIILLNSTACKQNTNNDEIIVQSFENIIDNNIETKETYNNIEEIEYTDSDMKVIDKFNELETNLDELLKSEKIDSVKSKAKEIFITTVDFIFYEGEINGITFDELSDKGKEKILTIASSIDSKIEDKFPDYKESISSKTNDVLNKASELINKGMDNIKDFSKDKLGDKYDEFVETKNEVIEATKKGLITATNISKEAYSKGKTYVKNWYDDLKK